MSTPVAAFAASWKSAALCVAIGVALLVGLPSVIDDFTLIQVTIYIVMSVLAVSLGYIWGYGGILCFGQAAFFGLGAYTYAISVVNIGDSTVPFLLSIVVPAAFAAILGYVIFYCPGNTRYRVIDALEQFGGQIYRMSFDDCGLTTWGVR